MKGHSRSVAFLRAINVGGRRIRMEALRTHFEEMGFTGVETFIASGNVIFDQPPTREIEGVIENGLRRALGYDVETFLRSTAEIARIANASPFGEAGGEASQDALFVGFLREEPSPEAFDRVYALRSPVDDFYVDNRELYWLRRATGGDSAYSGASLEKALRTPTTVRNVTTLRRLAARYA